MSAVGKPIAQYNGAIGATGAITLFVHRDHLGSTRVLTTAAAGISDSMDYLPFGEQITTAADTSHKFTGKEHDNESGLDFFGFRYYSSSIGRFVSIDPGPYDLTNPQSLNRYTYVLNSPVNLVDEKGAEAEYVVDRKKHTITIYAKIGITGKDANAKYAAKMEKAIHDSFTGTYKDKNGQKWAVTTIAQVAVLNEKNPAQNASTQNVFNVDKSVDQGYFRANLNSGTTANPRYYGEINPERNDESHEGGHVLGLGDDYYSDTNKAVADHTGHLMAGGKNIPAAQDEMDRLAGYIIDTGNSQGTVTWLPGAKTSTERTAERKPNEKQ